ncbi:MAG: hypothetical protein II859_00405 [Bacteroidales bacterium]|nr:hypothetical protein [Bacteroidales bacterium]
MTTSKTQTVLNIWFNHKNFHCSGRKEHDYRNQPKQTIPAAGEEFGNGEPACDKHNRHNQSKTDKFLVNMHVTQWTKSREPDKNKTGDNPKKQVGCKVDFLSMCLKKLTHCTLRFNAAKIFFFQKPCENPFCFQAKTTVYSDKNPFPVVILFRHRKKSISHAMCL